jgi:hypothetical protein
MSDGVLMLYCHVAVVGGTNAAAKPASVGSLGTSGASGGSGEPAAAIESESKDSESSPGAKWRQAACELLEHCTIVQPRREGEKGSADMKVGAFTTTKAMLAEVVTVSTVIVGVMGDACLSTPSTPRR